MKKINSVKANDFLKTKGIKWSDYRYFHITKLGGVRAGGEQWRNVEDAEICWLLMVEFKIDMNTEDGRWFPLAMCGKQSRNADPVKALIDTVEAME